MAYALPGLEYQSTVLRPVGLSALCFACENPLKNTHTHCDKWSQHDTQFG